MWLIWKNFREKSSSHSSYLQSCILTKHKSFRREERYISINTSHRISNTVVMSFRLVLHSQNLDIMQLVNQPPPLYMEILMDLFPFFFFIDLYYSKGPKHNNKSFNRMTKVIAVDLKLKILWKYIIFCA